MPKDTLLVPASLAHGQAKFEACRTYQIEHGAALIDAATWLGGKDARNCVVNLIDEVSAAEMWRESIRRPLEYLFKLFSLEFTTDLSHRSADDGLGTV